MASQKRIRRALAATIGPVAVTAALDLLHATCRFEYLGFEEFEGFRATNRPYIITTWHYELFTILQYFKFSRALSMVSPSRDGDNVSLVIERWGYEPVRGSKHKGGMEAVKLMIRGMRDEGRVCGLIADGSKGPPFRAQKGSVFMARATGAPILPVMCSFDRFWRLYHTWDKTELPKPFARVAVFAAPLHYVPPTARGAELEKHRLSLENTLNELKKRARAHFPAAG